MATSFTTLQTNPREVDKAVQWYQAQIKQLGTLNPQNIMKERERLTTRILPGKMYLFFYDPKHKDTLPYYDRFPLVLPFRKMPDGFIGLNLHYLPYLARFKLLGYLADYLNNDKLDETSKLQISWKILNSSSRLSPMNACVKRYLADHVESKFYDVPVNSWITAALLPVERFVGANKSAIWRDSRNKY